LKTQRINILNVFKLVIAAVIVISGCQLIDDIVSDEFTYHRIQVDSVMVPDSISASQTLTVNLWGKAGNDTCDSFSHYQASYESNDMDITVWGKQHYVYRVVCPDAQLPEENYKYNVSGIRTPVLNIHVHQPNGVIVTKSVIVY